MLEFKTIMGWEKAVVSALYSIQLQEIKKEKPVNLLTATEKAKQASYLT